MTDFPRSAEAPGVHPDAPPVAARDMPPPHVLLATPTNGGAFDSAYLQGFGDLRVEMARRGFPLGTILLRGESDVVSGRNRCMAEFLASAATHLLFVDSDIGFSADAVFRLLAHDVPLVGATYRKKSLEVRDYAVSIAPRGEARGGLVEVNGLAGGFLLIQRRLAERMAGAFTAERYDVQDGRDDAEPWRRQMFNLFGPLLRHGTRWSEDISFCMRARDIGERVWLDPHILLEHWGMARFASHPAEMFTLVQPGEAA
jgi:hypothetical protein